MVLLLIIAMPALVASLVVRLCVSDKNINRIQYSIIILSIILTVVLTTVANISDNMVFTYAFYTVFSLCWVLSTIWGVHRLCDIGWPNGGPFLKRGR